ncbi:hypothetical protein H5410_026334 [Solanum commersonii]|uniref:Uncharacterized protein n=1 Tax=Solanum commersonii TaxID=4109 RepID=A0A9J5YWR8_SOLCO|nr:hypothetical protein H5410_026334 [Solanum commersonii]
MGVSTNGSFLDFTLCSLFFPINDIFAYGSCKKDSFLGRLLDQASTDKFSGSISVFRSKIANTDATALLPLAKSEVILPVSAIFFPLWLETESKTSQHQKAMTVEYFLFLVLSEFQKRGPTFDLEKRRRTIATLHATINASTKAVEALTETCSSNDIRSPTRDLTIRASVESLAQTAALVFSSRSYQPTSNVRSALVASSSKRIFGSLINALAIAILCFCPPDN